MEYSQEMSEIEGDMSVGRYEEEGREPDAVPGTPKPCRARSRESFRSFGSDMSNVYKLVLVGVGGVGKSCLTIQVSSAYEAR